MEIAYDTKKTKLYEQRADAGRKLAYRTHLADIKVRKHGKTLKVVSFPQHGGLVPSIRVAGKWLDQFGFQLGDPVILTAAEGRLVIKKRRS
jgi:hypothetical protein